MVGIAYPTPARLIKKFNNKFLFCRLTNERTIEKIMVKNAAISPRPIVLNKRVNNSIVRPF